MSEEVWLTCVTHAFSTETEEIMGLLLGDIEVLFSYSLTFAISSRFGLWVCYILLILSLLRRSLSSNLIN